MGRRPARPQDPRDERVKLVAGDGAPGAWAALRDVFPHAGGGDSRHVVEYLSEAVLQRLDDATREFLLRTSILDRLCTSLCEALIGRPTIGSLEQIERSSLFLVSLDHSRSGIATTICSGGCCAAS